MFCLAYLSLVKCVAPDLQDAASEFTRLKCVAPDLQDAASEFTRLKCVAPDLQDAASEFTRLKCVLLASDLCRVRIFSLVMFISCDMYVFKSLPVL